MNEQEVPPGFASVMQNYAYNPATPFRTLPTFGDIKKEENKGIELRFPPDVVDKLETVASKYGFSGPVDFINTAMSVYGQMLVAKEDGFTQVVLLNPETNDIIPVQLTRDDM
jgi:hypothetical protein